MTEQLYQRIRTLIEDGALLPLDRLPSTRELASLLGVGRVTVLNAYERLLCEGYIASSVGRGSFVSQQLPQQKARKWETKAPSMSTPLPAPTVKATVAARFAHCSPQPQRPFAIVCPDYDSLPGKKWTQIVARLSKSPWMHNGYSSPEGSLEFRKVLTHYVRLTRGICCDPEQIIITSSIQEGLSLCSQILFRPGDRVAVEDPSFPLHTGLLHFNQLDPYPVDIEAPIVEQLHASEVPIRGMVLTPSHQFPLGSVMSLTERQSLLRWALASGAYLIEDDHDCELMFEHSPIPALFSMMPETEHVIYLGSFSKTIYPGLVMGYMIVPKALVSAFVGAKLLTTRHSSEVHQTILSEFIAQGHFEAHVRKLKTLYQQRRQALWDAIEARLAHVGQLLPSQQGTYLCFAFHQRVDDVALANVLASAYRMTVLPLSTCYHGAPKRTGFVLGYAGFTPEVIHDTAERLARAVTHYMGQNPSSKG